MTKNRNILYRAWNDGELLYIGITINPGVRFHDHSGQAAWWALATHVSFERLPEGISRSEALALEARAIRDELPRFNIMCNPVRPKRSVPKAVRKAPVSAPETSGSLGEMTDLIRTTRARITELDDELPGLVREAFCEGKSWRDIAGLLGVSKARVYQLRAEGKAS